MMTFGFGVQAKGVNSALYHGIKLLQQHGYKTSSRGMETVRAPGPVMTLYTHPLQRVLVNDERDANPFFHLIDALWLLSGSNQVGLPRAFLPRIVDFSDDGQVFHGAYGHRLFGGVDQLNQIATVVNLLKEKPDTRQAVVSIWDKDKDLARNTKDMPCNDMVMFDIVKNERGYDQLNMTVNNRSNDIIWGAFGANAVQFSVLLEYVAACVGVEPGFYVQFSNNFHAYTNNPYWVYCQDHGVQHSDPYVEWKFAPYRMCMNADEAESLRNDCRLLDGYANATDLTYCLMKGRQSFMSRFFKEVVLYMVQGYLCAKAKDFNGAYKVMENIQAEDWRCAAFHWVGIREKHARAS